MDMMDFTAAGVANAVSNWNELLGEAQRVLGVGTTMAFMIENSRVNSYMEGLRNGELHTLTPAGWALVGAAMMRLQLMINEAGRAG